MFLNKKGKGVQTLDEIVLYLFTIMSPYLDFNSKIFMYISYLIHDQQLERKLLNHHGDNCSERHLNVKINQQVTNLQEISSC